MPLHQIQYRRAGLISRVLLGLIGLLPMIAWADALSEQRQGFLAAESAIRRGEYTRARGLIAALGDYPLKVYAEAELFAAAPPEPADLRAWFTQHRGSLPTEALLSTWLRKLALKGDWQALVDLYQPQEDKALRCAHLHGRLRIGAPEGVAAEAAALWLAPRSLPPDCDPVFAYLQTQPEFTPALHWQRLVLALERGNADFAAVLARSHPRLNQPWAEVLLAAASRPETALQGAASASRAKAPDPRAGDIRRLAYRAWAKRAPTAAAAHYAHHPGTAEEDGLILAELALALVAARSPEAGSWLDRVPAGAVDAQVQNVMLRYALSSEDWPRLARWTALPPAVKGEPVRWRYFQALALDALGEHERARRLYHGLVTGTDYYNIRAAERLGLTGHFEAHRHSLPDEELTRLGREPAVLRARELRALGRLVAARKEWQAWVKHLLPQHMAGAAILAHRSGWYDRALLTAAKIEDFADVEVRYPLAFREAIEDRAEASGVPAPILFSVVRSESAFQADAGSPVGAMGLMQLMPGTGRETAAKLNLELPHIDALFDPTTNLTLGTAYLQRMLRNYDGNLAMAAAAYNAGPGRVAQWRPRTGCSATESWVEAIPFSETYGYVRRVLAHAVVYAWRLGEPPTTLKTLAPVVPARDIDPSACPSALATAWPAPPASASASLSIETLERP